MFVYMKTKKTIFNLKNGWNYCDTNVLQLVYFS